jgi:gliding motility-associated-like protein
MRVLQSLLTFSLFSSIIFAQQGKNGASTVTIANTVINEYTALTGSIGAGATFIPVTNSALNSNGRFTSNLQPGDLIMIIQVQGVWIRNNGNVPAQDTSWGRIDNINEYYQCGRYELRQVVSVPNANTIEIDCPTTYSYMVFPRFRAQVLRIPRYTTLTVNVGGSITSDNWNGTTGGIVAAEVMGNCVVNGSIDGSGRGFRGGSLVGDNVAAYGVNFAYSILPQDGADRGESVVGYQADYDFFGGRYGRAAGANGGAGGDAHNAGGGGGANGPNGAAVWSGNGIPDPNPAFAAAWNLEPPLNTMTLRTAANSSGGGRGGYTFSSANRNAGVEGPGNINWGGDARNHQATGLGGRPLYYGDGRLFMGGGGGAGDQNQSFGGNGGNGGGLIYLMVYGSVSGTGTIVSNGNNGGNATGTPPTTSSYGGADAAGGGGAGGTIVANAVGGVSGVTINANGGMGGNQILTRGPLYFGAINEAEGPGGGGGGGYIAVSSGTPVRTANGGNNGTTNSDALTEFNPNGATRGCPGTINATITNWTVRANGTSICAGQTVSLNAITTGTLPGGAIIGWYNVPFGGSPIATGATYNTGPLASTITLWVGICPGGWYRDSVVITVNPAPTPTISATPASVCAGATVNLSAGGGTTYTWNGGTLVNSTGANQSVIPAATTTYTVTVANGGCTANTQITVTVTPTPAAPTVGSNSPLCVGQTVNLTSNTVVGATYAWTGPNGFNSPLEDPTIVNATTAATGTYSLTVTVNGCTSPVSTVSVVVNPTPVPTSSATPASVCSGTSVNLTAGGGTTYTWNGGSLVNANGANQTVTPAATITYTVTVANGVCTANSQITVTVTPTPAAPTVSSNSPICAGNALNLTSNTIVGATYSWTGPNGFNSPLEDPTIANATTAATGTYSLTVTVNGCTSTVSTVSVTVNPGPTAPALTSNSPVCEGTTLNLNSNTYSGATYSWTGPNGFTSPLEDPSITTVTPAASGTYTLNVVVGGCPAVQSTITVSVTPRPAAPAAGANTPLCEGSTLNLTSNTVVGATYSWTGPNSFSSPLEDPTISNVPVANSGTYSVTITVNGCASQAGTIAVVVNPNPSAVAGTGTSICDYDSIQFNASGGGTYSWSPGTGLNATNIPNPVCTVNSTTTYTLTVTDANGCTDTDQVTITVNAAPVADAGTSQTLCSGNTVNITATGGATYSWNGGVLVNATGANQSVNPSTTTTYTVVVTDVNNCSATDSVTINVNALPIVTAGNDVQICSTGSAQLNASGASSYVWTPASGLSSATIANPIANPASTTTYIVVGTDGNGCSAEDTITVTVSGSLAIFAGNDLTVCQGDTVQLSTSGGTTYVWSPAGSLDNPNSSTTNAFPSATTTYIVNVSDASGCQGADTVTVFVSPSIQLTASGATTICIGQQANISAAATGGLGTINYTWSNSATGPGPHVVSPTVTTAYTVTASDSVGCTSSLQTVTITVNPALQAAVGSTASVCAGGSATINATATGGDGSYTFTWMPGNISGPSITVSPSVTTTYSVIVSDGCGSPADTQSVLVTVNPLPVVALTADVISGCAPLCVNFTSTGSSSCVTSAWQFGDGNISSQGNATNCYQLPGTFSVSYTCTDANGCIGSDTIVGMIDVFAAPDADFSSTPAGTVEPNVVVNFFDLSTGSPTQWNWTFTGPSGSTISTNQNPNYTPADTGSYTVMLVVSNAQGCSDTLSTTFSVENPCGEIFVPNAFSPNGDGQNDTLFMYGGCLEFVTLEIYSRWGEMVFSTRDATRGWDGRWRDQACEPGVFTYVLTGQRLDGTAISRRGNITIIR